MNLIETKDLELEVLRIYFSGNTNQSLSYLTFSKIDNKKVHQYNYFGAKVYLSQDNEEDILVVSNSKEEVDKIIYFVGGENDQDLVAMFGNVWVFCNESLYERFSRKIENEQEYILEE